MLSSLLNFPFFLMNEWIPLESRVLEAERVRAMQLTTQRATNYLENPTPLLEDSGPGSNNDLVNGWWWRRQLEITLCGSSSWKSFQQQIKATLLRVFSENTCGHSVLGGVSFSFFPFFLENERHTHASHGANPPQGPDVKKDIPVKPPPSSTPHVVTLYSSEPKPKYGPGLSDGADR